ncbi:MAG: dTDP-4-dehydrorhamnose 3,5-epimerase [Desulfobacteraceae bacterium]|jgi:dTDP-4-dehydrorhamnose 3,5-epimerase|nr:dTDP-4-dehydrorhamnose 3,5-epimerase [Desulfobacteraceae bacterium]
MDVNIKQLTIPGVLLIEPKCFEDSRGYFMETFHQQKYQTAGIDQAFVQDNHSHSSRGVLRGLHYQLKHPQGKLIYAVTGTIFDVAVDIRKGSPTYGQWTGAELSAKNKRQIYVPQGFAHGFVVLSESADIIYKCTDLYAPGDEYGVLWSDPDIGIDWPVENPILSQKDIENPKLNQISESYLPG